MKKTVFLAILTGILSSPTGHAQMSYEYAKDRTLSVGTYGRIGVDWSFDNNGSIGRRLNLNNMGSIGGRLEEQDYVELAMALGFKPFRQDDSTRIITQMRLAAYSTSLSLFANTSSSALGGLTLAIPELFVEARNINNSHINVWIGARLYRGPDVHIADYRYFNDYSGQGFGVEFRKTRFAALFVSSTDTTASYPPYFFIDIASGTPSLAMRQRTIWTLQHDIHLSDNNILTLLGEYHRLGNASEQPDSILDHYTFPVDHGFVAGVRLETSFRSLNKSYNRLALRYGTRIANGGDGGMSRTWLTYGAPDLEHEDFSGAYSISLVDEILVNHGSRFTTNAYLVYTKNKGAAAGNDMAESYFDKMVYNRKEDLTMGMREAWYIADKFHLLGEVHFSQRKDGTEEWARCTKLSLAPVLVPTGSRDYWARPQIRFVTSVAFYNKYAKENLYSPYLQYTGPKSVGYYLGFKAEWWIWN